MATRSRLHGSPNGNGLVRQGQRVKKTPKKAKFARLWLELGNASEAYRQSYNISADTKPETVWDSACKLLQDPWVAQRVMELEKEAQELHFVSVKSLTV